MAIVETGARNADVSRGAYKFPIQEGRLLSMVRAGAPIDYPCISAALLEALINRFLG